MDKLIRAVQAQWPHFITKKQAGNIVNAVIDQIQESISVGYHEWKSTRVPRIGTFTPKLQDKQVNINPQTLENVGPMKIQRVNFRPSIYLKRSIRWEQEKK